MNKPTDRQKKIAFIVVAILLIIHFAPQFIHQFSSQAHAGKSSPVHPVPIPPPPPPPPPEVVAAAKYGGIWDGDTLRADGDRCAVHLEIRLSDDLPKKLKGYSTVRCMPLQTLARGPVSRGRVNEMVRDYATPASAVMTGTPQAGGLTFSIDQTVSPASNGCAITGFGLVDFGQGQVMVEWQEGACPAGKMLLRKARG
jgi:hypothetical protein